MAKKISTWSLGVVFLVILSSIVAVLIINQQVKPRRMPQGVPPSLSRMAKKAQVQPAGRSAAESPDIHIEKPSEVLTSVKVPGSMLIRYRVAVTQDGAPVVGARVFAQQRSGAVESSQSASTIFKRISKLESSSHVTNAGGTMESKTVVRKSDIEDEVCEICAFHPEYGTDYVAIPCVDLGSTWDAEAPLELALQREPLLSGVIVDGAGNRLRDVYVALDGAEVAPGGVFLAGIWCLSDADGRFVIPGIRFGNTPVIVRAEYPKHSGRRSKNDHGEEAMVQPRLKGERIVAQDTFDQGQQAWLLGEVVMLPEPPAKPAQGFDAEGSNDQER